MDGTLKFVIWILLLCIGLSIAWIVVIRHEEKNERIKRNVIRYWSVALILFIGMLVALLVRYYGK